MLKCLLHFSGNSMKNQSFLTQRRCGFTVLELLVAMTVLVLVAGLTSNIVSGVRTATVSGHGSIEKDEAARVVLNRLQDDVARMLVRPDVLYRFNKQVGNDEIGFHTQTLGYEASSSSDGRTLSVVHYRVNPNWELERGATVRGWSDAIFGEQVLTIPAPANPSDPQVLVANSAHYDIIGPAIFRLEIGYLLQGASGLEVASLPPSKIDELKGLVVTVAVMDAATRAKLGATLTEQNTALSTLASRFVDFSASAPFKTTAADTWNSVAGYPITGYPDEVGQNIRVYQRYFYLP